MAADLIERLHSFRIGPRDLAKPMSGANTVVTMDGRSLKGVTELNVNIKANGMAAVTITMLVGAVTLDGDAVLPPDFIAAIEECSGE